MAVVALAAGLAVAADIRFAASFDDAFSAYSRGDYETAIRLFRPLAEEGNAGAQANLGFMYQDRYGMPQDDKQATAWFRKAADQDNARAQTQPRLHV